MGVSSRRLSRERIARLAEAFKRGVSLIEKCEREDPQMRAVERIIDQLGVKDGAAFTVGVAIVSYMLSVRGEEHWFMASRYAGRPVKDSLVTFIQESPSLLRFRQSRLKRIKKYSKTFLPRFPERFDYYIDDLGLFWRDLAAAMEGDASAKTVVFAVKMFYYALIASGLKPLLPREAPIPVDYRVCLMTLASGLVSSETSDLKENARLLRIKHTSLVKHSWNLVSSLSGLPPLRLDSTLWLVGGAVEKKWPLKDKTVKEVESMLGDSLGPDEKMLLHELLWKLE